MRKGQTFGQDELRAEIIRVFGEYGGHCDLFDWMVKERDRLLVENEQLRRENREFQEAAQFHVDGNLRAEVDTLRSQLADLREAAETWMRVIEGEDLDERFDGEATILRAALARTNKEG